MPVYGYSAPVVPIMQNYGAPIFSFDYPSATPTTPAIGGGKPVTTPSGQVETPLTAPAQNIASLPDITALTNAINAINLQAQQQANVSRIPGEAGLEQQSSNLIGQQLGGYVPPDVINLLKQQGAEQNVLTGAGSNAAYLRALGTTSLAQQQAGERNLSAAVARNPAAPLYDPSRMLLTPYEQGSLANEQARIALAAEQAMRPTGGRGGSAMPGYGGTVVGTPAAAGSGIPAPPITPPPTGGTGTGRAGSNQDWIDAINAADEMGGTPEEWYNYLQGAPAGTSVTQGATGDLSSTYDPFSALGLGWLTSNPEIPAGTVSGDQSSFYDPFADTGSWYNPVGY